MCEQFGASAVKALVEKQVVNLTEEKFFRSPYKNLSAEAKQVNLTERQKFAFDSTSKSLIIRLRSFIII